LLVHDGRQVTESFFMLQYLEDAFPQHPLRPADALGRSRILAWARFINEVFMPAANTLGCHRFLAPMLKDRDPVAAEATLACIPMKLLEQGWRRALQGAYAPELIEESRRKIALSVQRIEAALSQSLWLVGTTYSLADIDAFAICNALPILAPEHVNESACPRLMDWLQRIRARPAVRASLALSRTGQPERAFAPGPEHARWR